MEQATYVYSKGMAGGELDEIPFSQGVSLLYPIP